VLTSIAITTGLLVSRLPILMTRRFDGDEFEHAHVAWYLAHGFVPYRDFFEHHTLLFHYLLASIFSIFEPEHNADTAFRALFAARYLGWVVSGVILFLTFVVARRLAGPATGWVAMPIVAGNIVVALRAVEIRPDGLATVLWLLSIVVLHAALADPGTGRSRRLFAATGVAVAMAVLTSQKLLLAGPPLAMLASWYVASPRFGGRAMKRVGDIAWLASGVFLVWFLAVVFFAALGASREFVRLTVLEGVRWTTETKAATTLAFIIEYEPWLFALTAAGTVLLLRDLREDAASRPTNALLIVTAAGMFGGLFVIPVPYPQYCLTFVPLFAIIAARFLVHSFDAIANMRSRPTLPGPWMSVALAALVGLGVLSFATGNPTVSNPWLYPVAMVMGGASALLLAYAGRQSSGLVVALVLLSVIPAQAMRWMAGVGDRGQFAELRYVMDHTPSDGVVLDGWSGYGVFRRHADYYWMLHAGVRAMLTPADVNRFVGQLSSGDVRPDVVILDKDLRQLSPGVVGLVEQRYRPAGVGEIYVLR
jgi:hypothetical protein